MESKAWSSSLASTHTCMHACTHMDLHTRSMSKLLVEAGHPKIFKKALYVYYQIHHRDPEA